MRFIVDIEAARALANWKLLFANEVAEGAKKLAIEECTNHITLKHYQLAAQQALISLGQLVEQESYEVGWEEAA